MTTHRSFLPGALLLSLSLLGCGGAADGTGRVAIALSAAGASADAIQPDRAPHECSADWGLQGADVTFSSILARSMEGVLTDVTIDLPATVDLLAMEGGREVTLPIGFLPPGTYDQLVVVMTRVEFTLRDGTKIAITPPGGGWTAIVPVAEPFTVVEGETTGITLRFRRDLSFGCGEGRWEFRPHFECGGHRR